MKRATRPFLILLPLLLLSGVLVLFAQQDDLLALVQQAVTGERTAQARYAAFAAKADEEGFGGVASLFRAAARGEKAHEEKFTQLLKKKGAALPDAVTEELTVGTTRENIAAALAAEQAERDTVYHDAYEKAKAAGEKEIANAFDRARTAESEHANLLMAANWSMSSMKEKKTYFVCSGCGFTSETKLPRGCPLCSGQGKLVGVD